MVSEERLQMIKTDKIRCIKEGMLYYVCTYKFKEKNFVTDCNDCEEFMEEEWESLKQVISTLIYVVNPLPFI